MIFCISISCLDTNCDFCADFKDIISLFFAILTELS